jgi:hypothetical protein
MEDIQQYLKKADEAMEQAAIFRGKLPYCDSSVEFKLASVYCMLEAIAYQNLVLINQNKEINKRLEKVRTT